MAKDLATTAAANAPALRNEFNRLVALDKTGRLSAFATRMSDCVASTTVNDYKVAAIDEAGQLLSKRGIFRQRNPHADADEIEQLFREEDERAYPDPDERWYQRRTAFEDHWTGGREFLYFSLIRSGLGYAAFTSESFGRYALVLSDAAPKQALFPENTATYATVDGILDTARCESDATPWADRIARLTLQHAGRIPLTTPPQWDALISQSSSASTEVIAGAPRPIRDISEIRVDSDLLRAMEEAHSLFASPLPEDQRALARVFAIFVLWQQDFGLGIVAA